MRDGKAMVTAGALWIALGAGLALMSPPGVATVRPVRLDTAEVRESLEVVDEPYRVEPYLQKLVKPGGDLDATELVGFSVLIPLCGDGDGCELRLIMRETSGLMDTAFATGFLLTDSQAVVWTFSGYSTTSASGSNGNMTPNEILRASSLDTTCSVHDDGPLTSYQLRIEGTPAAECLLRIDD